MLREVVVIDTLGFASVKDSLFGNSDRYKNMSKVPIEGVDEIFKIKSDVIDKKNFPYKLVIAYWEDIVGSCEWSEISDIKKSKTAICCSFGWLVEQNENITVIMADFIFEDNNKIKTEWYSFIFL